MLWRGPVREQALVPAQAGRSWTVALLFVFMLINFSDKVVLGLAAVPIMRELDLTSIGFGLLASSVFLLFSISAIVAIAEAEATESRG